MSPQPCTWYHMSNECARGGKKLDKLIRDAKRGGGVKRVRVGYLGNEQYPDGTPVSLVALINEYGSPDNRIPQRAFFSRALAAMRADLRRELRKGYDPRKGGRVSPELAARLGEIAKRHIQASIEATREPPNAPATLESKRGSNPLVDSGQMADAVDYHVE